MDRFAMKRKMIAVLCTALLFTAAVPAAASAAESPAAASSLNNLIKKDKTEKKDQPKIEKKPTLTKKPAKKPAATAKPVATKKPENVKTPVAAPVPGVEIVPIAPKPKDSSSEVIKISASVKVDHQKGQILVTINDANEGETIGVYSDDFSEVINVKKGGTAIFTVTKSGTYSLEADYYNETMTGGKWTGSATVNLSAPPAPGEIVEEIKNAVLTETVRASEAGKADGSLKGRVSFSGKRDVVMVLCDSEEKELQFLTLTASEDGSTVTRTFEIKDLAPDLYTLEFYFKGDGNNGLPPKKTLGADLTVASEPEVKPVLQPIEAQVTVDNDAGTFTVKVTRATAGKKMIAYVDGLNQDAELYAGGTAKFTVPAAGSYALAIAYVDAQDDACTYEKTVTVGKNGAITDPQNKISSVTVDVTPTLAGQKTGVIAGKVSFSGEKNVVARLYKNGALVDKATLQAGKSGSFSFGKLGEGDYALRLYFQGETEETYSETVSVSALQPEQAEPVRITRILGGVKQMTVRGTAEPGQQIQITLTPAIYAPMYAMTGADGTFETVFTCPARVYTKVTAQYSGDASSAVTATGSYPVYAPAAKPEFTVDPIESSSVTVIAKTLPGVTAEISTSDFTKRQKADSYGVLRFSLPHTYAVGTKFTFTVYYGENNSSSFVKVVTVVGAEYDGRLRKGDVGEGVRKLTTRLRDLGYPVSVTDKFDSQVERAVRLFQEANGLTAHGEAGRSMQAALYSPDAIAYGETRYPTLVRGDHDIELVYTLQRRLKDLGYYTLKVDGIFGSGTQRAIRDFQRRNGLAVTGRADDATQRLLYSSEAKPAYGIYDGEFRTLKRSGKYQSAVVPLQRRLKALGYYGGSIDGYFGSLTYRAVRDFQKRNGLEKTGVADPYTQSVLYSSKARAASGSYVPDTEPDDSGYRLLYWGCEGSDVKRLQNALIAAGYKSYVRKADGIYGQWTYDAVCAYQKDHGLTVDGIAGRKTQNSLYGTNY